MSTDAYTPITLDDLGVAPVTITVKTPYGREIRLRVILLTASEWAEIGAEVPAPPEPPQRTPATLAVWRKHSEAAEEERNLRRVVYAMEGGGNPLPGSTLAEKAANLRKKADRGIIMSVWIFLRKAAEGDEARVIDSGDSFLDDDGGDSEHLPAPSLDIRAVEGA